ncbi:MAG TPA: polymer-forming cytoskeletal protein [Thermoanaerobaculia bacterium]|jgi:cytoskeletal protein CcmA (bactofilin family)|nr:polymer-forming cytoskeletal protein [Thermoanaerobaculia bacterium]
MIFKSDGKQSDLNGFLDKGSHLEGTLRFQTTFRVDGNFTGKVQTDGDLIVGDGGEVEGDLTVGQAVISGTVRGSIRAARRVQITPTGKVFAEIDTPSLAIDDGALFEGRCTMVRDGKAAAPAGAGIPKLVPKAAREG